MNKRWFLFAFWLALVGIIIALADLQHLTWVTDMLQRHPGLDKVAHFLLIGILAFLFNQALGHRMLRGMMLGSLAIALILTVEEISQRWIPGRTFDYGDMIANIMGCTAADLLARRAGKKVM